MVVTWNKFKGTIRGKESSCTMEITDITDPSWYARFFQCTDEKLIMAGRSFEVGELEQAYEWCVEKINEYEG